MNLDFYDTPYTKVNSMCFLDLNVRAKMMKLLEENRGKNICDLGLGNSFLDMISKAQAKTKI